ncbi:poly-gamma-glutamate system protein [candidate division KSB1 bacterium]|nr:poly-gamma-glutamate system protein [candidate division KSB1 bacterium]
MKFTQSHISLKPLLSSTALIIVAVILIMTGEMQEPTSFIDRQKSAARRMQICHDFLTAVSDSLSLNQAASLDPNNTQLIGDEYTPITTTLGNLSAKRTATNPDFAALLVRWFHELQLKPGNVIAIGCSGSFPALTLATICAAETMDLTPVIISAVGASSYGANRPDFVWLDTERLLFRQGLIHHRSSAASLGGAGDRAFDLTDEGRELLFEAISRNGIPLIYKENTETNIQTRTKIYEDDGIPKLFINIGGAQINVGDYRSVKRLKPGINKLSRQALNPAKSMVGYFSAQGVPIIHFLNIEQIALVNDIAIDPVPFPVSGKSRVYYRSSIPGIVWTIALGLVLLSLVILGFERKKIRTN